MANEVHVQIHVEVFGDHRGGLWCSACLLPSVIEQDFMLMMNDYPDHMFTGRLCLDCGRYEPAYPG